MKNYETNRDMGEKKIRIIASHPKDGQTGLEDHMGNVYDVLYFHPEDKSVSVQLEELGQSSINENEYEWVD